MYESLALLGGFILLYSIVAGGVERSWISGPIVFTLFGLLIGPVGLDLLPIEGRTEVLRTLAEVTLALVLFTDAAGADLRVLRRAAGLPVRLLLIGLPLTIALGYVIGVLLNVQLTPLEIALVATMLAPTDAALGKAVVTNEVVPGDVRQSLNVESGLNDGICVPILFVFLALAQSAGVEGSTWTLALGLVAEEIGIGLAVDLDSDPGRRPGNHMLRHGTVPGGKRLHRGIRRRAFVRGPGEATAREVPVGGRGHGGYLGPDHLDRLRRPGGR
jgi:NhaP-type Na+/H+ or K+/H+ antiporter